MELNPGDVTGDGDVSLADAILALQIVCGFHTVDIGYLPGESGADVNNDFKVGTEEGVYVLQVVAGKRSPGQ